MSSLLIRFFAFMLFLLFGLSFGWTVLLAGVIFLIAIGNVYWENILLGFLFDILFNFPFGFFTIIFSVILSAAVLLDDFFKSDAIFNRVARGVAASTSAAILFFFFFTYSNWSSIGWTAGESAIVFAKIIIMTATMLILLQLIEPKLAEKKFFQ